METSILIARVVGIYIIVSGVFMIVKRKTLPILLRDMFSNRAITHIAGILLVLLGGFMVVQHNIWNNTYQTWITILGWLILLKGLLYIFIPKQLARIVYRSKWLWSLSMGIIILILGIWLATL